MCKMCYNANDRRQEQQHDEGTNVNTRTWYEINPITRSPMREVPHNFIHHYSTNWKDRTNLQYTSHMEYVGKNPKSTSEYDTRSTSNKYQQVSVPQLRETVDFLHVI
jgi:hypothetical protein